MIVRYLRVFLLSAIVAVNCQLGYAADATLKIGFGKQEVTPEQPLRLSGYGTRERPFESVADKLYCRAMVLSNTLNDADAMVLVSIDSIAVTAELTGTIARAMEQKFSIPRSQLVICSTHSHAAPHVHAGLQNLFRVPLTSEEKTAIQQNTDRMISRIEVAIVDAMNDRQPGKLEIGEGQAAFAVNRRVLKNGLWSTFGVQADGPVDHRVRVLRATDAAGKLRGAVFMYACHCTTLGPDFNRVSGDWAGLAASQLESEHAGAIVLATIGCGADANPNPRTGYDDAKRHALELASAVKLVFSAPMQPLESFPVGHFGYAGLAPEQPTRDHLKKMAADANVANRNWATSLTDTWNKMGRLPETYPAPIHTWQFGDDLTWVFLGGEVVVDYQIGLERALPGKQVWVAAYTDDVFAYVASERMRAEGGYEVDFSMIYYQQPGRWQSGTEQLIHRRTKEILAEAQAEDKPRDAAAALRSIRVADGFQVDLMAAEPLVADPINLAFGHDGKLWVVEMADYPLGSSTAGRVRWLRDSDGDGRLDQSEVFLDGLSYPTGATPWRDGVIVITAPDVILAKDTDGDGRADKREVLLSGIHEANPQHRASGFEVGVDGWLYLGAGDGTRELVSKRNGQTYANLSGRDLAWNPDTGEVQAATGHSQFCRARDEWDNWFGNSNSQPIFQYVIEQRYLRNRSLGGSAVQHLLEPPTAPPVYPISRTVDRFNDLFALNRFTSACSSIICRIPGLGPSMRGAALVCEPVHNLVARFQIDSEGIYHRGRRFETDSNSDWFASSDPWSRPVRVVNSPDGTVWIVDMVRRVIEHPQWIPTAWQERFDLRAGQNLGRIYRVRARDYVPSPLPDLTRTSPAELARLLGSDNGALRDLAEYQLLWREPVDQRSVAATVRNLAQQSLDPAVRLQAIAYLTAARLATVDDLEHPLQDTDPRVVRFAVRNCESSLTTYPRLEKSLANVSQRNLGPAVDLQILLSLGQTRGEAGARAVRTIASRAANEIWLVRALTTVSDELVSAAVNGLLASVDASGELSAIQWSELEGSMRRLLTQMPHDQRTQLVAERFTAANVAQAMNIPNSQLLVLSGLAALNSVSRQSKQDSRESKHDELLRGTVDRAYALLVAPQTDTELRSRLINLIGNGFRQVDDELEALKKLIAPNQPPEIQNKALTAAGRVNDVRAAELLIAAWPSMTADSRRTICTTILRRREWIDRLVTAMEKSAIKVADLDAATVQQLRSNGDRSLMARAEQLLGKPANSDRAKLVQDYLAKLPTTLDRSKGEMLYREHCAACHLATDTRALVGPPLENLKHWTTEQWIVAMLDPNRNIEPKYHQYSILTTQGQVFTGIIEQRGGSAIQLAASDGSRREIPLADVESIKDAGISLMPEGIESKLSPSQLGDLLEYVRTKN